jgi:hypothetical protein
MQGQSRAGAARWRFTADPRRSCYSRTSRTPAGSLVPREYVSALLRGNDRDKRDRSEWLPTARADEYDRSKEVATSTDENPAVNNTFGSKLVCLSCYGTSLLPERLDAHTRAGPSEEIDELFSCRLRLIQSSDRSLELPDIIV